MAPGRPVCQGADTPPVSPGVGDLPPAMTPDPPESPSSSSASELTILKPSDSLGTGDALHPVGRMVTTMRIATFSRAVFIAALALGGSVDAGLAQGGIPISLTEAADLALRQNPTLRRAQAGVDLADAQLSEARLSRLPSVQ